MWYISQITWMNNSYLNISLMTEAESLFVKFSVLFFAGEVKRTKMELPHKKRQYFHGVNYRELKSRIWSHEDQNRWFGKHFPKIMMVRHAVMSLLQNVKMLYFSHFLGLYDIQIIAESQPLPRKVLRYFWALVGKFTSRRIHFLRFPSCKNDNWKILVTYQKIFNTKIISGPFWAKVDFQ